MPSWGIKLNESKKFSQCEYRTDGKGRASETTFSWGDISMSEHDIPKSDSHYDRLVVNNDFIYHHNTMLNQTKFRGELNYQTPDGLGFKSSRDDMGYFTKSGTLSYFLGYFDNRARLDGVLKNAKHISVRQAPENINGFSCYVVEADTKYGDFTVWFDSEHGYLPARIKAKMGVGDDIGEPESPHVISKEEGIEREYTLDNIRFEKIDGTWVPMEADSKRNVVLGSENGFSKNESHFKFTKIALNPDHETLNSFGNPIENPELDPKLSNGTIVFTSDGLKRMWLNGKIVADIDNLVIDELDNIADEIRMKKPKEESLSVIEVLDKYTNSQNKIRSLIAMLKP